MLLLESEIFDAEIICTGMTTPCNDYQKHFKENILTECLDISCIWGGTRKVSSAKLLNNKPGLLARLSLENKEE